MSLSDPEKMKALTIAAACSDAYSADCWGPVAWVHAAQMLIDMGFSDGQVEWILRSKHTRWARDSFGDPSTYLGALYHSVLQARRSGDIPTEQEGE